APPVGDVIVSEALITDAGQPCEKKPPPPPPAPPPRLAAVDVRAPLPPPPPAAIPCASTDMAPTYLFQVEVPAPTYKSRNVIIAGSPLLRYSVRHYHQYRLYRLIHHR